MPTASSCAASPSSAPSPPPPSPWASVNARRSIWPGPQPASQCDRLTDRTACRILGKDTRSTQEASMVALTPAIQQALDPARAPDHARPPHALQKAIDTVRAADNGRHAELIINDGPLRQTVIALTTGTELAEHNSPPAASIHVIHGALRITGEEPTVIEGGEIEALTHFRHAVEAIEDTVFL